MYMKQTISFRSQMSLELSSLSGRNRFQLLRKSLQEKSGVSLKSLSSNRMVCVCNQQYAIRFNLFQI